MLKTFRSSQTLDAADLQIYSIRMKTKNSKTELFEIILPFPNNSVDPGAEVLFDDCPLCQELKRQIESGEVTSVPIQWEMGDAT